MRILPDMKALERENTLVNVTQIGDAVYTMTESSVLHKVDIDSLETLEKVSG